MDKRGRLKNVWHLMKHRCNSSNDKDYKSYGARGIRICPEWYDFDEFFNWAVSSGYEYGLSIDRINNDGSYSPNNCRWTSVKEQANNRRSSIIISYDGLTKTVGEWSDCTGIPYATLHRRMFVYGWETERALTTPVGKRKYITYEGKTLRMYEWAKLLGINYDVLESRINQNGWGIERAFTEPVRVGSCTK